MAFSANDLMALVRAGFSARQIEMIGRELSTESPAPSTESPAPSTESTESTVSTAQSTESIESTAQSTESTGAAPVQAPAAPAAPSMGDIMAKLDALTRAVNAGAIRNDQQPGAASPRDSAADIMAQIINPTYKKEE